MPDAAARPSSDLCAGYGTSQVLENVSFSMGVESVAIIGRNGMGKSTLCDTIIGLVPTTSGTVTLGGTTLSGRHPETHRPGRDRLRPAGTPPVRDAHRRRAHHHARQGGSPAAVDAGRGVRAVPPPRPTTAQPCRRPVRRRAADARRRPRPAAQRIARDDGRAVRRTGADDRRHADRGRAPPRRRGRRRARRRAEPLRRHAHGRARPRDGRRAHRGRDDGDRPARRSRPATPLPRRRHHRESDEAER